MKPRPRRTLARPAAALLFAGWLGAGGAAPAAPRPGEAPSDPAALPATAQGVRDLLQEGRYGEAEGESRRLLRQVEAADGRESLRAAEALDLLVQSLWRGGKSNEPEARLLGERALALKEKALGPDHPDLAATLNNLAGVLSEAGDYAAARPLYERALSIQERVLGPDHPDVAVTLFWLAGTLWRVGDFERAQHLCERVLAMRERRLGPDHPEVASALNGLGILYMSAGDCARARPLLERALAIREKALGPDHPDRAIALNNNAMLLGAIGDYASSVALYERALRIWDKRFGPDHLFSAYTLDGMTIALVAAGEYERARPVAERAVAIRERALGPGHPLVAESLNRLAAAQWGLGLSAAALESSLRAEGIAREHFRQTARSLSEDEALRYERIRTSGLDVALSVIGSPAPVHRGTVETGRVWDELVRSRALVLDEMASRHRTSVLQEDPGAAPLVAALDAARNRLARLVLSGPETGQPERYRDRLREAQEGKDRAERVLMETSSAFRREQARGRIGLREAAEALPGDAALVAYVQYTRLATAGDRPRGAPAARPGFGAEFRMPGTPAYLAFVLRPGEAGPSVVPLGRAEEIDGLIRLWRKEVSSAPRGLAVPSGRAERRCREAGERLRRALWDPVTSRLEDASQVFVVPDGGISLVGFGALPSAEGHYLVESGPRLHYLSAERDLVRAGRMTSPGRGLLVVGGPDFDARPAPAALAGRPPQAVTGAAGSTVSLSRYRGPRAACSDFRSLRFKPLPSARLEAEEIGSLWAGAIRAADGPGEDEILELIGPRAGESAFKQAVSGHRVVHVATHGFFGQGDCPSALEKAHELSAAPIFGDNPLLLSGLALAGANRREEAAAAGDAEDGILTSEEIASLDLSGVEWLVLSACETGVGRVLAGEGVLGLRRACEMAGAGTLIMSLWSVEDAAAREWMRRLYEGRLSGRSTAEAIRQASVTFLEARRRAGKSTHPFYWGAFVAAGDWR